MTSTRTYPYDPAVNCANQQHDSTIYSSTGQPIPNGPNDDRTAYENNATTFDAIISDNHHGVSSVVIEEPVNNSVIANQRYVYVGSREPVILTYCPACVKQHVGTTTRTKPTGTTWLVVVAGFFIFWPLCWLPLCIRPMKQTNHYCNSCGKKIGRVKPFQ